MSENNSTETLDLQLDEDLNEYLNIALANGFSKGTANVSARDMVKLKGLLAHYAKKAHPFTACYNDQIKHGLSKNHAAKRCAVLKDLIKGTTKWRSSEKKKNLSEDQLAFLFEVQRPDNYIIEFVDWAANLDDETVNIILSVNSNDSEGIMSDIELEAGDVAWSNDGSMNDIRRQIEAELNEDAMNPYEAGVRYWVDDLNKDSALVCAGADQYFVVPFSVTKKGVVELEDEDNWKPVERAWVEANVNFSDDTTEMVAELFFSDSDESVDSDGLIWKTFLREGTWAYSPGAGVATPKPMTITASGESDKSKLIISMAEIKKNFDAGAIQHVTVPTSHDDKVLENTGFVKKMRFGKDEIGRTTLEAAIDFTEPDVKEKALRGTIPNVSGGIHFNYIDKEKGKKYNVALGHLALTPKPWLQGMTPFSGVKASENLNVVGFSEVLESSDDTQGGVEDTMTTVVEETNVADTFLSELNMSEDEVKATLADYAALKAKARENDINQKVKEWEDAKKSPAVIKEAKAALLADQNISLNLSDEGKEEVVSLSELVDRIVAASPEVVLADDPITEENTSGEAPPDDTAEENLSDDVKNEARRLFLYERYSEEDALAEAIKRSEAPTA